MISVALSESALRGLLSFLQSNSVESIKCDLALVVTSVIRVKAELVVPFEDPSLYSRPLIEIHLFEANNTQTDGTVSTGDSYRVRKSERPHHR